MFERNELRSYMSAHQLTCMDIARFFRADPSIIAAWIDGGLSVPNDVRPIIKLVVSGDYEEAKERAEKLPFRSI